MNTKLEQINEQINENIALYESALPLFLMNKTNGYTDIVGVEEMLMWTKRFESIQPPENSDAAERVAEIFKENKLVLETVKHALMIQQLAERNKSVWEGEENGESLLAGLTNIIEDLKNLSRELEKGDEE